MSETEGSSKFAAFCRQRKNKLTSNLHNSSRKSHFARIKPLHPGAFTKSDDFSTTFASPTYLNSLIDYYYGLPSDQQFSAKSEGAFKPFSFATLPDPSWWKCDLRDEDVCEITSNVKSAADGLYGVDASESDFEWSEMGEQPKYAQLYCANKILSIIATDLESYNTTGHFSGQSSTFKRIGVARYEINSDTSGILDILKRHRTEPMLAKFRQGSGSRTTRQGSAQATGHEIAGRSTDTSHVCTAAGVLDDADERQAEAVKQQLVEQANMIQRDIATLARYIHEYRRRSATTGATSAPNHTNPATIISGQNPCPSQGAATVPIPPSTFPPQPTDPSFATCATHATLAHHQAPPIVLPPSYRTMPSTHFPMVGATAPRGAPPVSNGPSTGTGYGTLAYTAGATAAAWVGYELYKGGYMDSAADSVASWWSGDHEGG